MSNVRTSSRDINLPLGFHYISDFLSEPEECDLIRFIETLAFAEIRMHGVTAKRRTVHFELLALRERIALLIEQPPDMIEEVLITDYPPGAGIGWHRDAPMFGP